MRTRHLTIFFCTLAVACAQAPPAPLLTGLPKWMALGGEIRGRGEMFAGINFVPGFNDGYYLSRIRLNLTVQPAPWLRFFVQAQDSQAPAYSRKPVPSNVANTFDLRQACIDLGRAGQGPWGFRVGRQEIALGEERLVGASNWGNVGRTFDAVRFIYQRPGVRVDAFSGAVVVPVNGRFDTPHFNNKFHGLYASFDKLLPRAVLQPYFFIKTNSHIKDERGAWGDLDVYTTGARLAGKLPRRLDYTLEMAAQTGHSGRDDIRAWAGHWQLGYTFDKREKSPRLIAEYNYATGDARPGDGKRGTFDQLYPTNHSFYGTADQVGWRNVHDVLAGVEWKLGKAVRLRTDYHSFWLASRGDGLYTDGGGLIVGPNPAATVSHIGQELDAWVAWRYSDRLQIGAGIGRLFAGGWLRQAGKSASVTYPYIQFQYSF